MAETEKDIRITGDAAFAKLLDEGRKLTGISNNADLIRHAVTKLVQRERAEARIER